MPATGILNNEHSQGEGEAQNLSTDSVQDSAGSLPAQEFENNKTEVSMEGSDPAAAAIQSSSMDVSSEFVVDAGPEPNSSIPVTFSKVNKSFQNTFSALTSASCGDAEDETNVDVSTSAALSQHTAVEEFHDSTQVPLAVSSFEYKAEVENERAVSTDDTQPVPNTESDVDMESAFEPAQGDSAESAVSDCVYFIQATDATGQVVTSVIDPSDISLYADSVIYKQWLNTDGEIETAVVHTGSMETSQNHTQGETDPQQQDEQQIIYTHDNSGQLTQLDPDQYTNDVPPPGKQFVYMQDTSGRIIRTVVDASQNMVPGQHVYYTQSDDGQIITSLMDSSTAAAASAGSAGEQQAMDTAEHQTEGVSEHPSVNCANHQLQGEDAVVTDEQLIDVGVSEYQQSHADIVSQQKSDGGDSSPHQVPTPDMDRGASFSIDNTMSGLSMLAELSHLTSGQGVVTPSTTEELKLAPVADSCNSIDMDGFRAVANMTGQDPSCSEGLESVRSDIAGLKVTEADSDGLDQGSVSQPNGPGHSESLLARIVSQISQVSPSFCRDNLFVQWQNLDAMCWMDVVLIMLVHSPSLRPLSELDPGHELASTLLVTLLKANRQAQILLQNLLKKHNGAVISDPNSAAPLQDPKTSKLVCKENMDAIGKAINVLYGMREKIWQALQPRLRCERGKHNSPVLVLPLLVRENPSVKQMFTMRYRYVFKCDKCSYTQDDSHSKILPSIPAVPEDFNMTTPCFVRSCFECQAPNQRMMMKFEQLQDFVQMHFVKGLPHSRFDELSFDFNDDHYEVTAFVHYKNNPDHFIAWVRNAPGTMWMECDDLKSVITRYVQTPPNIPPSQVHMVMWERRLTPQHRLVMRDTEDTRLLSSLVLTVQQPNTHHTTESDTRSSSGTTAGPATSQSSTSLLSGLMTQSLAHRGRGVGSNGVRAGVPGVSSLRHMNPAAGNPQPAGPPRVIRLPLSALTNAGLNLRGGPLGATRYMFVGNNSQGGDLSRASMSNRVVVVRTPGGTTSMSATQLLQLLQQSGTVGQVGTRLAAAASSSGANTVAPTAAAGSYIVQQDGTIVPASTFKDVSQSIASTEQAQSYASQPGSATLMETSNTNTQHDHGTAVASPTISTLPFITTGHTVSPQPLVKRPEPETSSPLPLQGGSASATSCETTGGQSNLSGDVVKSQSQQSRYLKVTNPGGGTFLCQLAMKDGKMVLIPVDRSVQSGSSDTSLPKLSSAAETPGSSQEAAAVTSGNLLAQIKNQLLQSRNQGASSRARLLGAPGTLGGQTMQVAAGSCTPAEQPAPTTDTLSPAGQHTTPGDTSPDKTDGETGSVSSSAVSLLKAASARQTPHSSPSQQQQRGQETYRYVHPGSNTTHILHTGTSETHGSLGQSGNTAAIAVSSSSSSAAAAVDGQPTSAAEVSSGDPELILVNSCDNEAAVLTPKERLSKELDTTEYIPRGRGRPRGAQRGGRGRGRGRRGRGRGRFKTLETEPTIPSEVDSHISTFSDLKQIGAHMIRAESESVDGVPVVSIPDFSTEIDARTIMPEVRADPHTDSVSQRAQDSQSVFHAAPSVLGSQLAAQQVPSVTTNHSFNALLQGIHGSPDRTRQHSTTLIHARSLLTGKTTTLQSPSSFLSSLSEATTASRALTSPQATGGLPVGDAGERAEDAAANSTGRVENAEMNVFTQPEDEDSIMSVEENQSTAERYRMPAELFQPEEDSPEKSVKLDESNSRISGSVSPGAVQEFEMSSLDDTEAASQKSNTDAAFCSLQSQGGAENAVMEPESVEHTSAVVKGLDEVQTTVGAGAKVRKGRYRGGIGRHSVHESEVDIEAHESEVDIEAHESEVDIEAHKSEVNIETHESEVDIEAHESEVDIEAHESEVDIEAHESEVDIEAHGAAASSADGCDKIASPLPESDRIASPLPETNAAKVSSPEKESLLHLPTDSVEESLTSDALATECGDRIEDGLQNDIPLDSEEEAHSAVRSSRKKGRPTKKSSAGRGKRGGRKNSKSTKVTQLHLPDSDAVQHTELQPVGDSCSAQSVMDSSSSVAVGGELKGQQDITDHQHDRPVALLEGSQPDGPVDLVQDGHSDEPQHLVEDGQCDGPISLVEHGQCDGPISLVEDGQCDGSITLAEDGQSNGHEDIVGHHDEPLFSDDGHHDGLVPLVDYGQPNAAGHCDGPVPLVEEGHCDGPVPLVEEGQPNGAEDVKDGHCDGPVLKEGQCDKMEGSQDDEPASSSMVPRKIKRSRGKSRFGRSKRGSRGKSAKSPIAESKEINTTGTDSSLLIEPAATSNGGTQNGTSMNLSGPENTSVPCQEPSDVAGAGSLVLGSATEQQLNEDHVSSEVNSQVETEIEMSLKVDSSKEIQEIDATEQESSQLSSKGSNLKESVSQHVLETVVESRDVSPHIPSEGFTHISSAEKRLMRNSADGDPSGESLTLTASSTGFTNNALLETDLYTRENSSQLKTEGNLETATEAHELEAEKNSKSMAKTKRKGKGQTRQRGKKRSNVTAQPEAEEGCRSETESLNKAVSVDPLPRQSPRAGPSQQAGTGSASSVQGFSGSLSGDGPVRMSEQPPSSDHVEMENNHIIEGGTASRKVSKFNRSKEHSSKHRGKRKSDGSVETSNTFPTVLSRITKVNLKSNENLSNTPVKQNEHRKRAASTGPRKEMQKKAKIKQEVKEMAASSPTVVCHKRKKVDWGVTPDLGNRTDACASFSYSVLSGRHVTSKTRHSSLDGKQESFVSPCHGRLTRPRAGSCTSETPSPAVVKRSRPKPPQSPAVDRSHNAIPLSMNILMRPGYSGDSVINDNKEAFTGVVIKCRRTRADWASSADSNKTSDLSRDRFQTVPVKYCKRLVSSLCATARVADGCPKKSVESEVKADSVDIAELENICSSDLMKSSETCKDALVDSGKNCDSEANESGKDVDDEVNKIIKLCDSELASSGKTCADEADKSGKSCSSDVTDLGETWADETNESGKSYDGDMAHLGKISPNELNDSGKTCVSNAVDLGENSADVVSESGKTCNDDVAETEVADTTSLLTTDDGSDLCAETQPDLAVCASDVSVNKSSKKSSRKTKGKHKIQRNPSTDSARPAKRAKATLADSCSRKLYDSDPPSHAEAADTTVSMTLSPTGAAGMTLSPTEAVGNLPSASSASACSSPTRRSGRTPIPSKKILEYLKMPSALKISRVSSASSDDRQADSGSDANS